MTYLIHAVAAASLLAGCASPSSVTDQYMNASVTLQPERTVAVGRTAVLRYDGAADSRCPPGVQCVWAGELAYKFTLTSPAGKEMFGLTAAKPAFAASTVAGLRIALGENPEPKVRPANAPAPAPAHPVTVTIRHVQ